MMEVILREDVQSLGKAGHLVRVKPGYARNFLLPRGLAFEATEGNKKRIDAEARARASKASAEKAAAEQLAAQLGAITVTLRGKAGEEGKLFGSVTNIDIERALAEQGVSVERRRIRLDEPIKALGEHKVAVALAAGVESELTVTVAPVEEA